MQSWQWTKKKGLEPIAQEFSFIPTACSRKLLKIGFWDSCFYTAVFLLSLRQYVHMLNTDSLLFIPNYLWARFSLIAILCCLFLKLISQTYRTREILCIAVFGVLGALSAYSSGNKEILLLVLFLAASKGVRLKPLTASVLAASITILVLVISGVFVESIETMQMDSHYDAASLRTSLGFNHPNSFSTVLFVILSCVYARSFPTISTNCIITTIICFAAIAFIAESRTFACGIILLAVVFILSSKIRTQKDFDSFIYTGFSAVAFSALFSLAMMVVYNPGSSLMARLDRLLSTRLSLAHHFYTNAGFSLFGHNFDSGSASVYIGGVQYTFLVDNAYAWLVLLNGIVPGFLVLLAVFMLLAKARKEHCINAVVVLIVVWSLVGIGEKYTFMPACNFALLGLSSLLYGIPLREYGNSVSIKEKVAFSKIFRKLV